MPTPDTLWQRLVDEAGEDAIESAAGVSVAQGEQDLTAAGFDVKAERAHASARIEELTGGPPSADAGDEPAMDPTAWVGPAAPSPKPSPASRRLVWLIAALMVAAAAGGILYAAAHRPPPPDRPVDAPTVTAVPPLPSQPVTPTEPPPSHTTPVEPHGDSKLPQPRPHAP
jgi:hypothetical protein